MDIRENRLTIFAKTYLIVFFTVYYSLKAAVVSELVKISGLAWQSSVKWVQMLKKSLCDAFDNCKREGFIANGGIYFPFLDTIFSNRVINWTVEQFWERGRYYMMRSLVGLVEAGERSNDK